MQWPPSSPELTTTTTTCLPPFTSENRREQFRGAEASAAAHLVGIGEGGANPLSMFGEQIRMTLGYMRFAVPAELEQ